MRSGLVLALAKKFVEMHGETFGLKANSARQPVFLYAAKQLDVKPFGVGF